MMGLLLSALDTFGPSVRCLLFSLSGRKALNPCVSFRRLGKFGEPGPPAPATGDSIELRSKQESPATETPKQPAISRWSF